MNIDSIKTEIEHAEKLIEQLDQASSVRSYAEVLLHTSRARAQLDQARIRSDEQLFLRRVLTGHVERIEREALGLPS